MIKPTYDEKWPSLWKECYNYDCLEFFGSKKNHGYRYAYQRRFDQIIASVHRFLPNGGRILDIAAAQGNFSLTLAEQGYDVTWNDLREQLIDYVKLKYERGKINFFAGNAFEFSGQQPFDGIIITEIIEHVAHPDEFLTKVASLVKPRGFIFMTTPLGNYFLNKLPRFSDCADPSIFESVQFKPNSDGHIFLLHKDELLALADKCNLQIRYISTYNSPITSGHAKTHLILPFLPRPVVNFLEWFTHLLPEFLRLKLHSNVAVVFERKP